MWSLAALVIGFCIDLLVGDPHSFPHPVVLIGKCISVLERVLRCVCPKTPAGERVTLPERRHRVQTYTWRGVPLITAFTRLTLGFQGRLERR